MKIKTLALVLGAAVSVAAGGMAATACSSSSDSGSPGGGNDAGGTKDVTTSGDSGNPMGDDGGNPMGDDGGTPPDDAGPDCAKAPTLHAGDGGTIYCGHTDAGSTYCPTGQQCCVGGKVGTSFEPEQCSPFGQACPNPVDGGLPVQCEQPANCQANNAGSVCCARSLLNGGPQATSCGWDKASGGTGLFCEQGPACAAGETTICESDMDCPTGMTCTPFKWKILQFGYCK
jgi:hypothetical protein